MIAEFIKFVGGLAGLASAAFLIYDRLVKSRPLVVLHRQSFGVNGHAFLRLINPADDDLFILSVACQPRLLGVAIDNEVRGIADAIVSDATKNLIIPPEGEAQLPIIKLSGSEQQPNTQVKITVRWKRTKHVWPWPRRISLKTSRAFVDQIESARPVGQQVSNN